MTTDEIKKILADRKITQQEFAGQLGMNPKSFNEVLRGARPMTKTLHNHIKILLEKQRETILVYRVNLTEAKVEELCGKKACASEEERLAALEAVIHHNLQELIEVGKKADWTEEERNFLGVTE